MQETHNLEIVPLLLQYTSTQFIFSVITEHFWDPFWNSAPLGGETARDPSRKACMTVVHKLVPYRNLFNNQCTLGHTQSSSFRPCWPSNSTDTLRICFVFFFSLCAGTLVSCIRNITIVVCETIKIICVSWPHQEEYNFKTATSTL